MTALGADRNTTNLFEKGAYRRRSLAAAGTYYKGQIIVVGEADNLLKPCTGSNLAHGAGISQENKTLPAGGGYLTIEAGAAYFLSGAAGQFTTATPIGTLCYGVDDQTVTKVAGVLPLIGVLFAFDSVKGPAVRIDPTLFRSGTQA